jgi:DNA polymerase (family 10)
MTQPGEEMTGRLIKALQNPYVRILAHPTGRYVLRREPFNFDLEKVFNAAKSAGVIMEVNANPERLDLCDRHVKLAHDKGIKVVISTDAHRPDHFQFMRYGVLTARRGWMEKKDVINTYSAEKLLSSLRPLPK